MMDRVAENGIVVGVATLVGHRVSSASPRVNVQVRVISRKSVSFRMSGGKGAKGDDIITIRLAASSRTLLPEERTTMIRSTLPSGRNATESTNEPKKRPRASSG